MPFALPDAGCVTPVILPDGTPHAGTVFLKNVIDHPQIEVGEFTYASVFDPPAPDGWAAMLAPYLFPMSKERLVIGRFCQIALGVRFITASANHAFDGLTSFPFSTFALQSETPEQPDQRHTIVGHDVWIGYGAMICPGARIGNGVIVGAGAVVRGIVPDYAVVTGNPAQVARMRFAPDQIARLNHLAWWHWPVDRIAAARPALEAGDLDALEALAS
ncbi:CatB-related O-acetyltransferase [Aliiroseovarius subalbicans]|uniref:CatB-related O-acetyltransferase n=1 Tax=Aliiroseovarius subalbicans TaxID=2925840 RepID=UPI001F5A04F9|nr:CatB-related O-acetyltransferase [Aliiroseovarius subalbicans]MCI2398901.1 CatB-related O-acetyltransferase [Aliiroseovarius subalbicans]